MKRTIWSLIILLLTTAFPIQASNEVVPTVKEIDFQRYMGRWYEIARFDHSFERGLVGVTATYKMLNSGTIKVINAGYKESFSGKRKEAVGKAKIPDINEPGKLKVSFFLWFYSAYNILDLAPDYRYALIGSSSKEYLWILCRNPEMDKKDLHYLLEKAYSLGYDTTQLLYVKQEYSSKRK